MHFYLGFFVIIIFLGVILEFNKYRYYFRIECLTHAVHASTRAGPINGQTLLSMAVFESSWCRLSNEAACVTNNLSIQQRPLFLILFFKKQASDRSPTHPQIMTTTMVEKLGEMLF